MLYVRVVIREMNDAISRVLLGTDYPVRHFWREPVPMHPE